MLPRIVAQMGRSVGQQRAWMYSLAGAWHSVALAFRQIVSQLWHSQEYLKLQKDL